MLRKKDGKRFGTSPVRGGVVRGEIPLTKKEHTTTSNLRSIYIRQGHMFAKVKLGQHDAEALIDTGASNSFIGNHYATTVIEDAERENVDVEVSLAEGTVVRVKEATCVDISFGERLVKMPLMILPEVVDDLILGVDYLREVGATLTIGKEVYRFDEEETSRPAKARCSGIGEKSDNEEVIIKDFLNAELTPFETATGLSNIAEHRIRMKDETPFKQRYMLTNPAKQKIISDLVDELLETGCIEPAHSPYSSPIVLAPKKNGKWRLCCDFRQLNSRSVPDAYPLPRINSILERLRDAKYFSTLDLKNGYWQIPMEESSRIFTAFTVPGRGLFQWKVMPFGLHSAPATFQRALDQVIGPEMEPHAFAYLDDIIVIGRTLGEHMANLHEVFRRLRKANLRINPEKCSFMKKSIKYLGHVVGEDGIQTDPEKIAAIKEMTPPKDVKGVRRVLGVASWYRRFVPDFADLVSPITSLLKKSVKWKWEKEQQDAFELLKERLTGAPVLACPDFDKQFILQTDASNYGLGTVLTQNINDEERVIAYASRRLNNAECNYSATEKECLAIVWGIRKMRQYLEGYRFKVITDHLSLKWLNSIESPTGRIARWALELQQYTFDIEYRRGKSNVVADALSREPLNKLCTTTSEPVKEKCAWLERKKKEVLENPEKYADFVIENEQLYRHIPSRDEAEGGLQWKLCVPKYQRERVLKENHDSASAGHLGSRKTTTRVAGRYYWPGLFRDVASYVRKCESCQKYKVSQQKPAGMMLTQIPDEPWAIVCADFVGPLPRSKHGNSMLLVIFDKFSKWTELIAMRKATTEGLKKALRERIVSRFGVPKALITDNGTQFTSRGFGKCLEELGIRHQLTAPYTPQENPTERANRTVKTMIAQFAGEKQRTWDEYLPDIMLAINSSVSESTGFSPSFVIQGREPRLPKALYDEVTAGTGGDVQEPEEKARMLQDIFKLVRRNMEVAAQDQRRHYNLRRRSWKPKKGDKVLVKQHHLSKAVDGFAAKLAPKYDGPYTVKGFVSPVIVEIDGEDRRKRTAHIGELKPFNV